MALPSPVRGMIATGFALPAIAALHACASLADLPVLDRTVPATWRDSEAPAAAPADALAGPAVPTWWSAFGDADVETLVTSALRQNLSIAAAGERVRAARLFAAHARDAFRPGLSLAAMVSAFAIHPELLDNYTLHPAAFSIPLLAAAGLGGAFWYRRLGKDGGAFASSSIFIGGMLASTAFGLFPRMLPASTNPAWSLTAYNSAADRKSVV